MNDNIWLVVWDLDRTFFDGGDSETHENYAEIIKTLIRRGIMNACCSRGSLQTARIRLEEMGVWDCLIFPSVSGNGISKAERVEQIIKNTRLRPQYTLYLDNNIFNRKLAEAALPRLNTARPDDIFTLIRQPEMKGFTDKLHVRLAQYKLAKPLTEGKSSSDFDVMAHAVMECALVDSASYISDIQSIFAESEALNYTGKRLSPDEVTALLNEPDIRHGCVTLKDIREDHGVVGFYAVRANKLTHFVFSSELMDIPGVEQWTYSKLGYPILSSKSKFCVGELSSAPAPDWINQSSGGAAALDIPAQRLLVRGSSELAGITRYLKKYVAITAEIFEEPASICYIAKGRQYTDEEKKAILRAAPGLEQNVFTTAMFSGEYDYVLVNIISERSMIKYSDKTNSALSVYLSREHLNKLDSEFFDQFQSYVYSDDELDDSLQYICDNLPAQTSLIIMTAPEVAFTRVSTADGSDPDRFAADYQRRLRYNAIAEEIVVRNTNAYLLDIRGMVKSEADLTDFHVLHYGPQVDYELSRVLTALLGVRLPDPNRQASSSVPLVKAKLVPDTELRLSYRAFIVNGLFVTQVEQPELAGVLFSFSVMMGSQVIDEAGFSADSLRETRISAFGVYWTRVGVKYNNQQYYFDTSYFVYNEKTVFNYIDKTAPNFANIHHGHLLPLYDASENIKRLSGDFSAEVLALLSTGLSVFDYFERRGIEEISILADAKAAPLIMDSAGTAKTRIKHLFTLDMPFSLGASLGMRQFRFNAFTSDTIQNHLGDGDVLLIACMPGKRETADITKLIPGKVKIVWLHTLLHTLSTERFFAAGIKDAVARGGGGPVIALRLPTIRALKSPSPEDRALLSYSTAKLLTEAGQNISSLPGVLTGVSFEKLSRTAILPPVELDAEDVWRFSDRSDTHMNIKDGLRRTVGQPERYAGTVYIFGGSMVFGKLVSDEETIASRLQASINLPLRVVNCANFDGRMQASRMLSMVNLIDFRPNDVIVIAMEEDQTASTIIPFQFKYIDNSFIKADALSVLNDSAGAYYMNNVYSPRGNELVADLLREKIYGLVRLF
ncbi:MAG: hypothetical protein LBS84_06760 [Clostridiales bacterium]|jgi:hypothetical protein|nr:hypothetical protein [Clostridiales bacterium]